MAMITHVTTARRSPSFVNAWIEHATRIAREAGWIRPIPVLLPLTRRQELMMVQDQKKADERTRRLELVRAIKAVSRLSH
jgi:hypothetical protein